MTIPITTLADPLLPARPRVRPGPATLFVLSGLICAALAGSNRAISQTFPAKPVRVITSAPGGSSDIAARLIGQGIAGLLGQSVIIENRGGGIAAIEIVARAPPDGHTLLYYGGILWLMPLMQEKTPYDTLRDFAPITWAVTTPVLLVVHPSLPVRNVKELIALAKARPGMLNYGSGGSGSSGHLAAELFKSMAGVDIVRIPYKGGGPALNDVVAGHLQVSFNTTTVTAPLLKQGRLRGLAVTGVKRSALLPEYPTVAEAGVPGYESEQISGYFAPAATSTAIVSRVHQSVAAFLGRSETVEQFLARGIEPVGSTPEQFVAKIRAEIARMGKVIRDAGIRAEP